MRYSVHGLKRSIIRVIITHEQLPMFYNDKCKSSLIMKIPERLKQMDWTPKSNQVDKETLKLLLHSVRRSVLFCWHDWVYWTFGSATKQHRVCRKCFKKQQDRQIIPKYRPKWIKERHYAYEVG